MTNNVPCTPYVDILLYTAKALKENFPNYNLYVDNNEEAVSVPSFFIKVTPLTQTFRFDWVEKLVTISISYVNTEGYQEDKLKIIDAITEAFGDRIIVGEKKPRKRALPVIEQSFEEADALVFNISLHYYDGKGKLGDESREYDALLEILKMNIVATTNGKDTVEIKDVTINKTE